MAYDYIGLTNEVNRRLNEVELTSSNFSNATGFYAHIKDAVNASIRDINHTHYEWPFNHVLAEETLTAGTTRYAFPTDASTIDFDTFRIKEDATLGNDTARLGVITYDDYLQRFVDQEYSTDTSNREVPSYVFHAPSLEWGVVPAPDKAYEIAYEYYRIPVDLSSDTDVPSIPERFKQVILDGAMYHAYMFRSNEQAATLAKTKFDEGIKKMRILLINKYVYMQSTAITQSTPFGWVGNRVK
jgi:hypothetical protein